MVSTNDHTAVEGLLSHTLSNCSKFSLFFRAELQHCVYNGKKPLSFTTRFQEDEPQQDILQVLQVSYRLLSFLISFQSPYFTFEKLVLEKLVISGCGELL